LSLSNLPARLVELAVTDLGIIDDLRLVLGSGMTALTGETGAGKTMVVGAIALLLGGRADASVVRPGAVEGVVEGRFDLNGEEMVLTRVIPADGRSRAYVNGRMATAGVLAERTVDLVDLHGQHQHQSLLATSVQRAALDAFGSVDLEPLQAARRELHHIEAELASMGGDAGARAREIDLLRYQLDEIDAASITSGDEDDELDRRESELADAVEHRNAAFAAVEMLAADGGAADQLGGAVAELEDRSPFTDVIGRLRSALAEVTDASADLRSLGESIEEDPETLATLRDRRQRLVELRRKYGTAPLGDGSAGTGTLADVVDFAADARLRLESLEGHDARAAELDAAAVAARGRVADASRIVARARREAAPDLARAVESHLADLAMAKARFGIEVGADDPGDDVTFMLAANPGLPAGPLSKVASGGELARAMLALRLVVSEAPPILVFDEVDAGIGGDAAVAVGRALAQLGSTHQVLVVTHLPQVAAFADHQVSVRKEAAQDVSKVLAEAVDGDQRVAEIARMLAGTSGGSTMHEAARELLTASSEVRGR